MVYKEPLPGIFCFPTQFPEYDAYLDDVNRAGQIRDRLAMRRRQAEAGVQLQEVATVGLDELERRVAQGAPLNLSVEQICRLAEFGARIERAARGEDSAQSRHSKIEVIFADAVDDDVVGQNPEERWGDL